MVKVAAVYIKILLELDSHHSANNLLQIVLALVAYSSSISCYKQYII
jgi:hypothetical protein